MDDCDWCGLPLDDCWCDVEDEFDDDTPYDDYGLVIR